MRSISFCLAIALAAVGCGPRANIDGKWEGKRSLSIRPGQDSAIFATLLSVKLELKDGKFKCEDAGVSYEGSVVAKDASTWDLMPKVMLNRPVAKSLPKITLHLESSGKLRYHNPGSPAPIPCDLSRSATQG